MYWQLVGTNLHVIGSIHVSSNPLSLNSATTKIIDEAEVVAFETNFDLASSPQSGLYANSNSLSKNIPPDLLADTQDIWVRSNKPPDELDRHQPWHAAFVLMNASLYSRGFSPTHGIDRQVIELAKRAGKNFFFLETLASAFEPFRAAPHDEQLRFLSNVVRNTEEGVRDVSTMVESWENNAPDLLNPIREKSIRLMPKTYAGALGGRNRQWLPKLIKLARGRKKAVAIVGALHMLGADGLPAMFGAAGIECRHAT
jgi:uncharacterized protein